MSEDRTRKRVRFRQVYDDGEWVTPTRKHKMACCDCGLVHNMEFRIAMIEILNGRKFNKPAVQFRASRNERSTAGRRRNHKVRNKLRTLGART